MYTYPRLQNLPYPARVLSNEGRFMRRSEVGQSESWPEGQPEGRCGAWGRASQARFREALGFRPARNWVCHCELAGRGQASGAKSPGAKSPEERTRVLRRRDGASKGVAVCLCFPAIREISRGCYKVRLSAFRLPHFFLREVHRTHHSREGICGQR